MKDLQIIQASLSVPKGQYNEFGGFPYRSCEDILVAVKPLLDASGCILTLTDEMVNLGERYYVKATVRLTNEKGDFVEAHGFAREAENKKGMDSAQLTGSCSSYARKYALAGLFLLDDNKDADSMDNSQQAENKPAKKIKTITKKQAEKIEKLIDQYQVNIEPFLSYYKIEKISDMPTTSYDHAVTKLEEKGLTG